MPRITVTVEDRHLTTLDALESEPGIDSRAEAVRRCITEHHRISDLEARVSELESELMHANSRIDSANTAIDTVERQQSLAERKARAGLVTKAKWALFGMDDE